MLEEEIEKIVDVGGKVTGSHLKVGDAGKEIVSLVEEVGIGMVVLGGREKGPVRRYFEGDVPEYVFRYALCPVLVVHARESEGPSWGEPWLSRGPYHHQMMIAAVISASTMHV